VITVPKPDDVLAIHQLLALYGHVVDGGDVKRLSEVFTDDVVFDTSDFDQGIHRGLPAIEAIFALGAPPHPPAHLATNFYVYEKDGVVRAHSKWLTIDRATGRVRSGDYLDELVQRPEGWRISQRTITIRFYVGNAPVVAHDG
jgi:hypothetical protein